MPGLALTVIVRAAVLGAGIVSYSLLLPVLFPDDGGGANIGAGLLGFALVVAASAAWGFVDGARRRFTHVCLAWSAASLVVALTWTLGLTASEAGSASGFADLLRLNLENVPFTTGLVLVPAVLAAVAGQAARGRPA